MFNYAHSVHHVSTNEQEDTNIDINDTNAITDQNQEIVTVCPQCLVLIYSSNKHIYLIYECTNAIF